MSSVPAKLKSADAVRVKDVDLHYRVRGEGPPLVMIMGWQCNMDWWPEEFLTELEQHFQLVLFDNRGVGRNAPVRGCVTVRQMAEDAALLMGQLGIERAHVAGMSMGGMIAQELALRHPEKLDRLALLCTSSGLLTTPKISFGLFGMGIRLFTSDSEVLRDEVARFVFGRDLHKEQPEAYERFMRQVAIAPSSMGIIIRQFLAVLRFHAFFRVPKIQAPTLVVTGTRDLLLPSVHSRVLYKRIPNSRLLELEGCGHGALGKPVVELGQELVRFLRGDEPTVKISA